MPFTDTIKERREKLLHGDLASATEIRADIETYLARTNLTLRQFAQLMGKGDSSLRHFMAGRYEIVAGSDVRMRTAIRRFLDANPITPEESAQGKLYETENVATLRHWFYRCLAPERRRGRMACVYAGPGSQKTFVTEHLVTELNRDQASAGLTRPRAFHIYSSQGESPLSLVTKLLCAAGVPSAGLIQRSLASLRHQLKRNRTLFIFDEAQHLSIACLEIIRELNDLPPYFGVMLLGSHKLREYFTAHAAEMEQWHSRITEAIELPGIAKETIANIVKQELAGLADFTTTAGKDALDRLLQDCLVRDIYSGRANQHYYSVRKVFMTIDQIREEADARKGVIQ